MHFTLVLSEEISWLNFHPQRKSVFLAPIEIAILKLNVWITNVFVTMVTRVMESRVQVSIPKSCYFFNLFTKSGHFVRVFP